jgi:hypothetical protein
VLSELRWEVIVRFVVWRLYFHTSYAILWQWFSGQSSATDSIATQTRIFCL